MYIYKSTVSLFALLLLSAIGFAQAPVAHFRVSSCLPVCTGQGAVQFVYDGTGGTPTTYSWNFQDGSPDTSSAQFPNGVYFSITGKHLIFLTVSNGNGSSSFTDSITVVSCHAAFSISSVGNNNSFCDSSCVNFIDGGNFHPNSWSWTFYTGTDTITSTDQNPTNICYNVPGSYRVLLHEESTCGNGYSFNLSGPVLVTNCGPIDSVNIKSSEICSVRYLHFSATYTGGKGTVAYNWSFPGGSPSSSTSASPNGITYSAAGTYPVQLILSDGYHNPDTTTRIITVTDCPGTPGHCSISFTLTPDSVPHVWDLVYTATGTLPITYTWDWSDGNSSTGSEPTHTYNGAGNYSICVTMVDSSGCTSAYCDSSFYLYRLEEGNSAVTVNVRNSAGNANGVATISGDHSFSIYPNPAENQLTVSSNRLTGSSIDVSNILGSTVLVQKPTGKENVIDVSKLTPGVYFLSVKYSSGGSEVRKFVKE